VTADDNPWSPDHNPPVDSTEWTYGWGQPYAAPPRRPWYKAPGSLIGASTFSAVFTWITLAALAIGVQISHAMSELNGAEAFVMWLFVMFFGGFLIAIGAVAFILALAGAMAAVPLAIVWLRDPERSTAAGLSMLHAIVTWTALVVALVAVG
jgi:hypothetical protein